MKNKIEKYHVRSNEEIGQYLFELIEKNYDSMRQFGIECLKCKGESTNDDDIAKMANRLSQIKKGKKGVQLEDLPVFSHLLNVSAEEILTAGYYFYPYKNRFTNYNFAMCKDKKVWQEYIDRDDQLILNTDEYGKTVIDYALEFENYGFLKYLTDEGYIWFVGNDPKSYSYRFGAATKLKRKNTPDYNPLYTEIATRDDLRIKMITLAIKNKDFKMLESLRARELPSLYFLCYYNDFKTFENYDRYCENMIESIADADEKVIKYFSEEFEIINDSKRKITVVFPYINQLIKKLVNNENFEAVLKRCIEHNRKVYNSLKSIFDREIEYYINNLKMDSNTAKETAYRQIEAGDIKIFEEYEYSFVKAFFIDVSEFYNSNIIYADFKSTNSNEQKLIDELNGWYEKICNNEF